MVKEQILMIEIILLTFGGLLTLKLARKGQKHAVQSWSSFIHPAARATLLQGTIWVRNLGVRLEEMKSLSKHIQEKMGCLQGRQHRKLIKLKKFLKSIQN